MKKLVIIITVLSSIVLAGNAFALSEGKITMTVIDEKGKPIHGATAFISYSKPENSGIGVADILKKGETDKDGFFTAHSLTMNSVGISAEKEDYYHSSVHYEFTSRSKLLNRWEPWNPTIEVVLKKKRNPLPMYRKYLKAEDIPILESSVGYDLEKGDWVLPYGKGLINDLVFLCRNKYESFTSAETSCEISFSNLQDGFQEYEFNQNNQSYYKWPFEAPVDGYDIKKLTKWMSVDLPEKRYESSFRENINYLYRVRTVVDKDGNIVKANYGKLKGDIRVYKKAQVNFAYAFNPDGTRNLEEDSEKNLFDKK